MSLRKRPRVSQAMLAANRANAGKSTGPRTADGKARSRLNRFKHGARSGLYRQLLKRIWVDPQFAFQHVDLLAELQQAAKAKGTRRSRKPETLQLDPMVILRKIGARRATEVPTADVDLINGGSHRLEGKSHGCQRVTQGVIERKIIRGIN